MDYHDIDWGAQTPLPKLSPEEEIVALREALRAAVEKLWEMDVKADRREQQIRHLRDQLTAATATIATERENVHGLLRDKLKLQRQLIGLPTEEADS